MQHIFARRAQAPHHAASRAPAIVHDVLAARGERLSPQVREEMGKRLGYDFSAVQVHVGERAAASAAAVSARAYAVGPHVVLGPGERLDDRELLAHELTHVARAGPTPLSVPAYLQIAGPDDSEERAAWAASVRGALPARPVLYRQLAPAARRDLTDYVQQTIVFLRSSASYYADPAVAVDNALVSRVLDSWYRTATAQGSIASGPNGSPALTEELRTAYSAAVATLLGRAAAATKIPLPELYRVNRGRIPPWAWQEPQETLPGIATPVPVGSQADILSGAVNLPVRAVSVSILPNAPDPDPKMNGRAETRLSLQWQPPTAQTEPKGREQVVTAVDPAPVPTATIQTFFGQGIGPESQSGYGRGTTPEDRAGAATHPQGGAVGFHEGQHGMDYLEFFRTHDPPLFGGRVGMTVAQFEKAREQWAEEWKAYQDQADAFSRARTDCVGVTIDQWEQQRGGGMRVKLVCPR